MQTILWLGQSWLLCLSFSGDQVFWAVLLSFSLSLWQKAWWSLPIANTTTEWVFFLTLGPNLIKSSVDTHLSFYLLDSFHIKQFSSESCKYDCIQIFLPWFCFLMCIDMQNSCNSSHQCWTTINTESETVSKVHEYADQQILHLLTEKLR